MLDSTNLQEKDGVLYCKVLYEKTFLQASITPCHRPKPPTNQPDNKLFTVALPSLSPPDLIDMIQSITLSFSSLLLL